MLEGEEDDYMSDKFLVGDVRPSLIQNREKKRQVEVRQKHTEHIKRQRMGTNSNERLQEDLKRPIEAGNKGYQLLAKMGYKPGQALGKEATTSAGEAKAITEPIGISIKAGRGGLGREAALRELSEKRQELRQKRLQQAAGGVLSTSEFRQRTMQKAEERFMTGALRRCQLSCENLDSEFKVEKPEMPWFWPERPVEKTSEDVDSETQTVNSEDELDETETDDYTTAEKVEMVTAYMRTTYIFCFWCGERYEDEENLNSNCPGLTRDDH